MNHGETDRQKTQTLVASGVACAFKEDEGGKPPMRSLRIHGASTGPPRPRQAAVPGVPSRPIKPRRAVSVMPHVRTPQRARERSVVRGVVEEEQAGAIRLGSGEDVRGHNGNFTVSVSFVSVLNFSRSNYNMQDETSLSW